MNLRQLMLAAERLAQEHVPIAVDASQCLLARDKDVVCDTCVTVCPTNAISLDGGVHVDSEACIRCGLCLHRCPVGVFDGRDGVYKLLHCASQIVDRGVVELACGAHLDAATGAKDVDAVVCISSCLSSLGPSAYVSLLALGVNQVRVRLDACTACPLGALQAEIVQEIETAQALLEPLGAGDAIQIAPSSQEQKKRPVYSIKNPPVSRRGFFQTITRQRVVGVDDIQLPDEPQISGERSAPRERRRLVKALRFVAGQGTEAPVAVDGFTALGAAHGCTVCGLCARVCPTGALAVEQTDDNRFEIIFEAAACTDCGICTRFCAPGVLQRTGAPAYEHVLAEERWLLYEGALATCIRCGAPYAAELEETMCSVCRERHKNPFSTWMPEELRQRIAASRAAHGLS